MVDGTWDFFATFHGDGDNDENPRNPDDTSDNAISDLFTSG